MGSNSSNLSKVNARIKELQEKCKNLKSELEQLTLKRKSENDANNKVAIAPEILDKQDEIEQNETQLLETKQYRDKIFGSVSGLNEYIDRKLKNSNPNLAELIEWQEYICKEIADNKGISQSNKDFEDLYENIRKINQRIGVEANIIETANYTGLARFGFGLLRTLSGSRNEKTDHKDPEIKSPESMKYHILHEQIKMKSCLENKDTNSSRGSSDDDVKIFAKIMTETKYGKSLYDKTNNEFKKLIERIQNGDDNVEVKDLLREAQNGRNPELIAILGDLKKMDNQKYVKYGFDLYREENGFKYLGQEQTKKYLKENKIEWSRIDNLATDDNYLNKIIAKSGSLIKKMGEIKDGGGKALIDKIENNKKNEKWVKKWLQCALNQIPKEKDSDGMDQISFSDAESLDENNPKRILHDIICENGFYLGKDIEEEKNIESLTKNKQNNSTAMQVFNVIASLFGGGASVAIVLIPIITGVALVPPLTFILPVLAIPLLYIVIKNVYEMVSEKISESRDGVEQNVEKSIEKAREISKNRGKEAGLDAILDDIKIRYGVDIVFTPEEKKQLFGGIENDKEPNEKLQKAVMNKIYSSEEYIKGLEGGINRILEDNGFEKITLDKSKPKASMNEIEEGVKKILYTDLMLKYVGEKASDNSISGEIIKGYVNSDKFDKKILSCNFNDFRSAFEKIKDKEYNNIVNIVTEKENKSEVDTRISDNESEVSDGNNPYKNSQYGSTYSKENNSMNREKQVFTSSINNENPETKMTKTK
jgi:hypothetical protein